MAHQLRFLGASRTVTGSRFLVEGEGAGVLVDCGLFQGKKRLRLRNWEEFPVPPASVRHVVLTHGHLDHCGWLPRLVAGGFRGPVHCTPPTAELAALILRDSARIQEEQAAYLNRKRLSKHDPALPLYDSDDAERALGLIVTADYDTEVELSSQVSFRFRPAGHILGSASVDLVAGERRVLFSGDLGRTGEPLMAPPAPIAAPGPDHILVECTYGAREHPEAPVEETLTRLVQAVVQSRGILLIPAFAVGRSTLVLNRLERLERAGAIPELPIHVDSPMAVNATELYCRFGSDPNLAVDPRQATDLCRIRDTNVFYVRTREESIALNDLRGPAIIVSSSGMLTGGRVLHHLKRLLPDVRNKLLLCGYQAAGTRGWRLQQGEDGVKVLGRWVRRRAEVVTLGGLSAHGDSGEVRDWLRTTPRAPRQVHLVHGEDAGLQAMADHLREELGWAVTIPDHGDVVPLN